MVADLLGFGVVEVAVVYIPSQTECKEDKKK